MSNSSEVWREFVYQLHITQNNDGRPLKVEYQVGRSEVDRIENEENGLYESQLSYAEPQYVQMNEWKKYFAWKGTWGHFRWVAGDAIDAYALTVSEDGKTCSLGPGKSAHANAWGERGWNKGILFSLL